MNKNKILIITHGFYPEQTPRAFRATELAKEFCRQGHEVTVMAPFIENMQLLFEDYPIHFLNLGKLAWKVPNLKGMGKFGSLFNKGVNRLIPLFFEFPMMEIFFKIRRKLKAEKTPYDLLISIAMPYPVHWGVASVWSKKREKNIAPIWIADCGDPYMGQENDTFKPPFYFGWIEKWFCKKVDYLTVPTEKSKEGYYPEFHSKIKVIPQGFRFEDIQKQAILNDGVIHFGYGGAFIPNRRDPRGLLDFLTSLDVSIPFEFHIFTAQTPLIESYQAKDSRIKIHQPIDRIALLEIFSTFQFVINFANLGKTQTPSKLIDYAIIEKPILQIVTGNLDTKVVLQFLQGNYEKRFQVIAPQQYRIENVVTQFLTVSTSGTRA